MDPPLIFYANKAARLCEQSFEFIIPTTLLFVRKIPWFLLPNSLSGVENGGFGSNDLGGH